uniref:NADH dehydrogenase subunit 6 n=1 Tax=Haplodiplatys aotouensis TaxID=2962943 RepID=UPI002114974E|nr:NADH dehydrogenase subunit 6 [Haplodiplatys aotouensis]UTI38887.1 NADH dehydrogenase subunit 6 [Haplodiplatys aotouensis]UTI38900.1 NADH dehydrogenase subunit 6 [Haplodiplatys aotouensis]
MLWLLMSISLVVSIMFIMGVHPLSMGLMLLLQTFLISLILGLYMHFFWLAYILFLVFLGGVLVMYMYVVSLASNEVFLLKKFSLLLSLGLGGTIWLIMMSMDDLNGVSLELLDYSGGSYYSLVSIMKMYSYPTCYLTLFLALYLLLVLVSVVKVVDLGVGPLRMGG